MPVRVGCNTWIQISGELNCIDDDILMHRLSTTQFMSDTSSTRPNLPESTVREAMERVLSSEEFHDSDRLQSILRYVIEETLAGRAEGIKATTIAVEVFGRDIDSDSESSSIVRVSAARLRRKLSHYYASSGQYDPIRIVIDTGSYVPTFIPNKAVETGEQAAPAPSPGDETAAINTPRPYWQRWPILTLGIALLVAFVWAFAPSKAPHQAFTGKPFVAVLPLVKVDGGTASAGIANGYMEAVVADLTKLSGLSVMAPRSAVSAANAAIPLHTLREDQGVTHVLKGTLSSQLETVRVSVQLIDTKTEEAVWAERFEGDLNDWFSLEDELGERIAAVLSVAIDPDESRRVYLRHTSNRGAMELLRQGFISINPPNEPARIEAARNLHQRVIYLDPGFAGGYAGMSQVHSYMVLFGHSKQPEQDLKSALAYAQKAIELDESFGMGHSMLGLAHSQAGQTDQALAAVRHAVALEPGDPVSYQWLGGVLIFAGREDEAIEALQEALRLDPMEPGTAYLNILGMAYFNAQQYDLAIDAFERSRKRGGPDAPNMEAYRAATYAALGRDAEASEVISHLDVKPGEISPERWIHQWTPDQKHADQAIADLHRLGMNK